MTRDELYKLMFEQQERSIKAMEGLQNSFERINDTNVLHVAKDAANYNTINKMVSSNEKVMKFFQWAFGITIMALVVLSGAEKVLRFL